MKSSLFLFLLFISFAQICAETFPPLVKNVMPEPGRMTATGDYPSGPSQIIISFSSKMKVNENSNSTPRLYYSECSLPSLKDNPIAVCSKSDILIDKTTGTLGSIDFVRDLSKRGCYRIVIDEGMWVTDTKDRIPSPELILDYFVTTPASVSPADNAFLSQFNYWEIRPLDCDEVRIDSSLLKSARIKDAKGIASYPITYEQLSISPKKGLLIRPLNESGAVTHITSPGRYSIILPPGLFRYITYGNDGESEEKVELSESMIIHFNIVDVPRPQIAPEEGEVTDFHTFSLHLHPEWRMLRANESLTASILIADGNHVSETAVGYVAVDSESSSDREIVLRLCNGQGDFSDSPLTPPEWRYCLRLAYNQLVIYKESDPSEPLPLPTFDYYFNVIKKSTTESVDKIDNSREGVCDVYSLDGYLIGKGWTQDRIEMLPEGFYIINGRIIVK